MDQLLLRRGDRRRRKRFTHRASVATYIRNVHAPTLLVQDQKHTLCDLQEAVATYRGLQHQGTPTQMIWQSWGHSDGTPAPGEVDLGAASIRDTLLGRRFLHWMDHYVRGHHNAPVGPRFCYFRDWVHYDTSAGHAGRAVAKAHSCRGTYTGADRNQALSFSGSDTLIQSATAVTRRSASYTNAPSAATSYSETSALEGGSVNNPPSDGPGTFVAFTTKPLAKAANIVGTPFLKVHLNAPVAAASQSADPGTHLMLFAKIYDLSRDGTITLDNRLVSPVRVEDVTRPVRIELPGVVQRIKAGHRIQVVIAASDMAYSNNSATEPVNVKTSPARPSVLRLPLAMGSLHLRP